MSIPGTADVWGFPPPEHRPGQTWRGELGGGPQGGLEGRSHPGRSSRKILPAFSPWVLGPIACASCSGQVDFPCPSSVQGLGLRHWTWGWGEAKLSRGPQTPCCSFQISALGKLACLLPSEAPDTLPAAHPTCQSPQSPPARPEHEPSALAQESNQIPAPLPLESVSIWLGTGAPICVHSVGAGNEHFSPKQYHQQQPNSDQAWAR